MVVRPALVVLATALMAGCAAEAPPGTGGPTDTTTSPRSTTDASPVPRWVDGGCLAGPATDLQAPLPDLVSLEWNGTLTRLSWTDLGVTVEASAATQARFVTVLGATVVTAEVSAGSWRLVARDATLAQRASAEVLPVTAMAAHGTTLMVVTRWNLTAYDGQLRELGRVDLQAAAGGRLAKAVHAIRVHDGHAYLLDDNEAPFYAFRVDVRRPEAMQVLLTIPFSGSQAPVLQWLDPAAGTWYVEETRLELGRYQRVALGVALGNGTRGAAVPLQASQFGVAGGNESGAGHAIYASTFTLPAWTIGGPGHVLSRLALRDGAVERSCAVDLPQHIRLVEHGRLLVTFGRIHVVAWETDGIPARRAEAQLPVAPQELVAYPGLAA